MRRHWCQHHGLEGWIGCGERLGLFWQVCKVVLGAKLLLCRDVRAEDTHTQTHIHTRTQGHGLIADAYTNTHARVHAHKHTEGNEHAYTDDKVETKERSANSSRAVMDMSGVLRPPRRL